MSRQKGLSETMRGALLRFPPSTAEPDQAWGVREGTRIALAERGLIDAVLARKRYTNQRIFRYKRTPEGDRVAAEIEAEAVCPRCGGSGEVGGLGLHGPGGGTCPVCNGYGKTTR